MVLDTSRSRRRAFLKTVGTASIVGLAGCSGDGGDGGSDGGDGGSDGGDGGGGTTSGGSGGDVVIGDAAPLSGNFSPWGTSHRRGLQFAVDEVNNDGGVLGARNLKLVAQDTEANPQNATTVFRRLVNNQDAVAVTGSVLSDVAIGVQSVAEELEVPHLPDQGGSPQVYTEGTKYAFQVAGLSSPAWPLTTSGFIEEQGYSKYGAIFADYSYGRLYEEGINRYIKPIEGLQTTVKPAPVGAQDFSSQLRQLPSDIDFLDIGGHPVGIFTIAQQALELGIEAQAASGPVIPTPLFYETLGEDVENWLTLFSPVKLNSDEYNQLGSRFYDQTEGFFDMFAGFGYVTGKLLAAAIEEAGEADPTAIRDALSGISFDSPILGYTISYTDWGELEQSKLYGYQFTLDAPADYPEGNYGFKNVYESQTIDPLLPDYW